jgi:hypothetical protein
MYENSVDKIVHAPGDQYSSKIQNKHRGLFKIMGVPWKMFSTVSYR